MRTPDESPFKDGSEGGQRPNIRLDFCRVPSPAQVGAFQAGPLMSSDPELALIVGAARSGTTLLRVLLDAHPEVACPAEAGLPGLMAHMAAVWRTIEADNDRAGEDPGVPSDPRDLIGGLHGEENKPPAKTAALPLPARQWIREAVTQPIQRYNWRGGKRLYVDKSLDSVFHLPTVEEVFPRSRYILLSRHVMDTIASGIEASPWGFQAYGYGPYVQASPHNVVAALASYFLRKN